MHEKIAIWVAAGCPAVIGSALDTISIKEAEVPSESFILRDALCLKKKDLLVTRGGNSCKFCLSAANRKKCLQLVQEWSYRITMVDLTHVILVGDQVEKASLCAKLRQLFPELARDDLESMTYSTAVMKARNLFLHIPMARQNSALNTFISRTLRFLTPTIMAGVTPEVKDTISNYVDAVAEGRLGVHESEAIAS